MYTFAKHNKFEILGSFRYIPMATKLALDPIDINVIWYISQQKSSQQLRRQQIKFLQNSSTGLETGIKRHSIQRFICADLVQLVVADVLLFFLAFDLTASFKLFATSVCCLGPETPSVSELEDIVAGSGLFSTTILLLFDSSCCSLLIVKGPACLKSDLLQTTAKTFTTCQHTRKLSTILETIKQKHKSKQDRP